MTSVTVERCTEVGISAGSRGSVELTGCAMRDNKTDYHRSGSASSIVVDGNPRPQGRS